MANETAFTLTTLREIFFRFDFTEDTTAEYDKASEALDVAIKAVCKDFDTRDEIDRAATEKAIESQALGFEQGVAFAMSMLSGSSTAFGTAKERVS